MKKSFEDLNNIFTKELTVLTISEPLRYCPEPEVQTMAEVCNFDTIFYINNLGKPYTYDKWKIPNNNPLRHEETISNSTSLLKAFELIVKHKRIFIKSEDKINRIATISDLSKIPFRIWLFGQISIFELTLRRSITINSIIWEKMLTNNRIVIATNLFNERKRNNIEINLLECLQLVDLGNICIKSKLFDGLKSNHSTKILKLNIKLINNLRNEIAHSNTLLTLEYSKILSLNQFIFDCVNIDSNSDANNEFSSNDTVMYL